MEKLDKVVDKIDKMDERLDGISITLVRNTDSLVHHIARTNLLEEYVKTEIDPIKKHVDSIKYGLKGIMWLSVALAGIAGFILTLTQLGILKL